MHHVNPQEHPKKRDSQDLVRASEVGSYVFCARAWWYHTQHVAASDGHVQRLRAGVVRHEEHQHAQHDIAVMHRTSAVVFGLGMLCLVIGALVWLFL